MTTRFSFALCGDDYAMTPGVSRGILEALDAGRLSATSVMTTSFWWPQAAASLRPFTDSADIGLHLNLTLGAPLGPMPTLAPDGRFPTIGTLVRLSRTRRLPMDEISAEIERQADAFRDAMGRPPDHVDGHQHVHVLAPIANQLVKALGVRGWTSWLRNSGDTPWRIVARRSSLRKAVALAILAEGFAGNARRAGFATNDGFAGFSNFDPKRSYRRQFLRYLVAPGARHLVMCHPGYVDDALRGIDPVTETREQELRFLLSDDFLQSLSASHATLGRLSAALP